MRTSTSNQPAGGLFLSLVPGLALACFLVAALPTHAQPSIPQKGLRITYLLYSGRPNPTVTVTDSKQVAEIEKGLAGVLATEGRAETGDSYPVLGYNGIMIERLDALKDEGWLVVKDDILRVEGGSVRVADGKGSDSKSLAVYSKSTVAVSHTAAEIEGLLITLGADAGVIDRTALFEARVD